MANSNGRTRRHRLVELLPVQNLHKVQGAAGIKSMRPRTISRGFSGVKMLQKLVKQRQESISIYETQQREDLAEPEREEVAIISKYLPEMMSEDDVRKAVKAAIEQTGAKSPAEMGKVMGVVTKALAGKADNKMVSALVKELLS